MTFCVYDKSCRDPGTILFKGRFFCLDHALFIKSQILKIFEGIERREKRKIPPDEKVGINNPRYVIDEFRRAIRLRGTHFVISKQELDGISRIDCKEIRNSGFSK